MPVPCFIISLVLLSVFIRSLTGFTCCWHTHFSVVLDGQEPLCFCFDRKQTKGSTLKDCLLPINGTTKHTDTTVQP